MGINKDRAQVACRAILRGTELGTMLLFLDSRQTEAALLRSSLQSGDGDDVIVDYLRPMAAAATAQPPAAQPGAGSELVCGTPIGDIIRGRLPNASKHMAHLLCDANDPAKGREAATVVSQDTLVTFAHETHGSWHIGKKVTVMAHDEHNSHRRPISCTVAGIDKTLDVVALKAHESGALVAPDVDSTLYAGLSYFLLGQSTQAQSDPSSVSHGVVSATQLDAHLHVRGDIQSGVGDSGGGVFATHSGKLIAMCVGADKQTKKAVFAPIAPVLQFVNSLATTEVKGQSRSVAAAEGMSGGSHQLQVAGTGGKCVEVEAE
uniref:Peptidase S1 domain-containing protein n=1 Tax=Chlamydomonas leiostraca TaxID=1034604 RepID=A0A6T8R416_9CHLO|mmetsp:Transcript_21532/g.54792  ORF Transcript_21532/g.54792 Transcript_21532/m.54792 type:complete len:319 (+) Transcript_21532:124-1080(+)